MTDLEKLLSIIDGKVEYEKVDVSDDNYYKQYNAQVAITVYNLKFSYEDFSSKWLFDKNDNLVAMGHWEK